MTTMTLAGAINAGIRRGMEQDSRVLVMGQDVGALGGVFRVTDRLQKEFGHHRVIDTPLAESGIVGTAIGLALRGYRPVCEIQFDGFIYPAFDQIVSQLAKMRARSGGRVTLPIVVRVPFAGGIGAVEHHSESNEALFASTPGLKVIACASPADGYALIQQAIACDDPVLFYEPKRRYWDKGEVDPASDPLEDRLGMHRARVLRTGTDCTLVAYGPSVKTALIAAEAAQEDGVSLQVVDLRSLSPLDVETLRVCATATGRIVVVHDASRFLGMGSEIAATVAEDCYYALEAPVLRVGAYDMPYPPSRVEEEFGPTVDRVLDAVDRALSY